MRNGPGSFKNGTEGAGYGFASSCATIAALTFFFGAALFPDLVCSSLNPDWSLNVDNAAASQKTLSERAFALQPKGVRPGGWKACPIWTVSKSPRIGD